MCCSILLHSVVCCFLFFSAVGAGLSSSTAATDAAGAFVPEDNFLLDCGATVPAAAPDGRIFLTDPQSAHLLSAGDNLQVSSLDSSATARAPSRLHETARVFVKEATYTFTLSRPGWHWLRLHFYPVPNSLFDLRFANFSVVTDALVLLRSYTVIRAGPEYDPSTKEFLIHLTNRTLPLRFVPLNSSCAFVNAIELVSAPDALVDPDGPAAEFSGLGRFAYQTAYRVNVGGPAITSQNDTLGRVWIPDDPYLAPASRPLAKNVSVSPSALSLGGHRQGTKAVSPLLIAPPWVYASAVEMADSRTTRPGFNVTWEFEADPSFAYLIRLHFCDIVSKASDDLYFDVYINGKKAISALGLSSITGALAAPYFKDVIIDASLIAADGRLTVQICPTKQNTGHQNAILNGLEVLKMSNSGGSLDGDLGVDGGREAAASGWGRRTAVGATGFAVMFGAFAGLGAMVVRWRKRPEDWQRRKSFSSWLLPLHSGGDAHTGKNSVSKSSFCASSSGGALGRYFSFAQLQEATNNFDESLMIGVGGFGNVYLCEIEGGVKVAVKRGNPQSEQGVDEFQTEIQMLSRLRHKHLVSLIGYCDENSEMVLVYEYMSNGPLRDHLYDKDLPPLSWKKRLEISIEAARGLHYLHSGVAPGVIHRDVKTTNILLDDDFVAKMADFGLSKAGPTMEHAHVSTAVKGGFGYLDPEYFRQRQLTSKSDVYSFGVVLLEILCARPAIDPALPREQVNLGEWAMQWKRKGLLEKIIDPHLAGSFNPESMKKFAEAAAKCLAECGTDRPTMGDVLWNLEGALQLQEASSSQGKNGDQKPSSPPVVAASNAASSSTIGHTPVASDSCPAASPQPGGSSSRSHEEVQVIHDHSGADMIVQFTSLNGR